MEKEKPPMTIELTVSTPIGTSLEEIFDLIKKIDEVRDFNHELHLKLDYDADQSIAM